MVVFSPESILRGAQLTVVGAHRALTNPRLFRTEYYHMALQAIILGVAVQIILYAPIWGMRNLVWLSSFAIDLDKTEIDDKVLNTLYLIQNGVLQVPFFLMTALRHLNPQPLDQLFMESVLWVDKTYSEMHSQDEYKRKTFDNLKVYPKRKQADDTRSFLLRYLKKAALSLTVYWLSLLPYVGWLILPMASFFALQRNIGWSYSFFVFGIGLICPKRFTVYFLQGYFASRSLVRQLLNPYFLRMPFTSRQKKTWFRHKEGILFGFGMGFYLLLKIPILGVLIYGIAQASAAYLITKITEPPPMPSDFDRFAVSQIQNPKKHQGD